MQLSRETAMISLLEAVMFPEAHDKKQKMNMEINTVVPAMLPVA